MAEINNGFELSVWTVCILIFGQAMRMQFRQSIFESMIEAFQMPTIILVALQTSSQIVEFPLGFPAPWVVRQIRQIAKWLLMVDTLMAQTFNGAVCALKLLPVLSNGVLLLTEIFETFFRTR